MKPILLLAFFAGLGVVSYSQITCTNDIYSDTTTYTNGTPNDSLYFVCAGANATLVATPPSGVPGWTFQWDSFVPASNSWTPLATATDVPSSTQSVPNGGYRVKIFDGTSTLVGSFLCWVCRVTANPTVNVNTIPAGCGAVNLSAVMINGIITPYYNPPVDAGPVPQLIIDANTEMTICFSGTHTWVSDLAFYIVGPASCGSPTLLLSPNPGAIGQGTVCNSGNNITNLCFSTESTNNLNVCNPAPATLSGTYGTYGPNATPINWSLLYGCDAANSGWTVQIYDCIGGDVGALTDATLTFSGIDNFDNPMTVVYSTPPGFNSTIADNSCSAGSASIFQVGTNVIAATPLTHNFDYVWTASPAFPIPNSETSLNITLDPGPTVDTYFTLTMGGNVPGAACGGTETDTEFFDYIEPSQSNIEPVDPSYCEQQDAFNLVSDQTGGSWNGTGITDATLGTFDPSVAGDGTWTINYVPSSTFIAASSIEITIQDQPIAVISPLPAICSSTDAFDLVVDYPGGTFSGTGITNPDAGTFDPEVVGEGTTTISYFVDGECPVNGSLDIEVVFQAPLEITAPSTIFCVTEEQVQFTANVAGGTWQSASPGLIDNVNGYFDPETAGLGQVSISYSYNDVCLDQTSIEIEVIDSTLNLTPVEPLCLSSLPVDLIASYPGGMWSGEGITNGANGTFDPSVLDVADTYTVYYLSNNACGSVDSLQIVVDGVPSLSITVPEQICEDAGTVILTASEQGGTWSGDGIVNAATGLFDPASAGSGGAVVVYTISGICIYTAEETINVNALPEVNAGNNVSMCYDGSVSLGASGAQQYQWSPTTGLSSPNNQNTTATPSNTTTYTVTGISLDGCVSSDQVVVTVYQEPNLVVNGPITICEGETAQLMASGLISYDWTGPEMNNQLIADPTATPTETAEYTVYGLDANGCSSSATVDVIVISPEPNFTASTLEGMSPLTVVFDNNSTGDSFFWEFSNGNEIETTDPNFNPTQTFIGEGTFVATLTVEVDGCEESHNVEIYVFYDSQIVTIPNVVTLGGDGKNDDWEILTLNMRSMEVKIFDRWGKLVGTIDKPTGQWDPMEYGSGTYYYVLNAEGYDGEKYERAGYLTVLEK